MNNPSPFLGIDFGTSYSKMAWYNPNSKQAEILHNAEGEEQTPSVVYFGESETLVGSPAEAMLEYEQERERVLISIKRELVTTPVIALPGGEVKPVDVAAKILHKLKRDAEEQHFFQEITRATITCPASFGALERDQIRKAAYLAGFGEVEMLEEPVAAAIAYIQMGFEVGKYVLVYDLGGGTFDLAVLVREDDGIFRPALEPQGIKRCGGDDFDEALYNFCDRLAREKLGRPISLTGKRDLHFLSECRRRKENLSSSERRKFKSLLDGAVPFEHEIDRLTFESLIVSTVEETVRKTAALMEQANTEGYEIDTVVLVGGSTRVPLTQRLLNTSLPLKAVPWQQRDVAVACGAAYHAYSLWGPKNLYRSALVSAWTDGKLDKIKIAQLTTLAHDLDLSKQQVTELECEIMGETKEVLFARQQALERYRKAVAEAWANKKLEKPKIERLTALAEELALSKKQVTQIERKVMGDTKKTIFENQRREQYRKAVEVVWSDKKLDQAKLERLVTYVKQLELSQEQVANIERKVMGNVKETIFEKQKREHYLAAVKTAWQGGSLTGLDVQHLYDLAKELALDAQQAAQIEWEVMSSTKEAILARQTEARNVRQSPDAASIASSLSQGRFSVVQGIFNLPKAPIVQQASVNQPSANKEAEPTTIPVEKRVLQVLQKSQPLEKFYVSPAIPSNKLDNARKKCKVPSNETILGLIDCTLFGSAKNCVLFGATGVYYHDTFESPGYIPYAAFPMCIFTKVGTCVKISGYGQKANGIIINPVGSGSNRDRLDAGSELLCNILDKIKLVV